VRSQDHELNSCRNANLHIDGELREVREELRKQKQVSDALRSEKAELARQLAAARHELEDERGPAGASTERAPAAALGK
jgi:MinD-like ATPase involved in chromosome partitioning or flagellar assembly